MKEFFEDSLHIFLNAKRNFVLFSSVLWEMSVYFLQRKVVILSSAVRAKSPYFPQCYEEMNSIFLSYSKKLISFSSVLWANTSHFPQYYEIIHPIFLSYEESFPFSSILWKKKSLYIPPLHSNNFTIKENDDKDQERQGPYG